MFSLLLFLSYSQLSRGYMFILAPFLHYHFLRLRYCSRRNPSVRWGEREGGKRMWGGRDKNERAIIDYVYMLPSLTPSLPPSLPYSSPTPPPPPSPPPPPPPSFPLTTELSSQIWGCQQTTQPTIQSVQPSSQPSSERWLLASLLWHQQSGYTEKHEQLCSVNCRSSI